MPNRTYTIDGSVHHLGTRQSLPGLRIEAWDKDLICDDLLGSAVTDKDGRFSITFDSSYFQELFLDRHPDIFFKVFEGKRLVHDTRKSVIWNLREHQREVVIEVNLPAPHLPEQPTLDRAQVMALYETAALKPAELKDKNPDLFKQLQAAALAELRRMLNTQFADSPEDLRKFFGSLDLAPLADQRQAIKDYLRTGLTHAKLSDSVVQQGLIGVQEMKAPETFDDLLQPQTPIRNNPLFQLALRQATTFRLAEFTKLDEAATQQLLKRSLAPDTLTNAGLRALVNEGLLSEDLARELGLNTNLYQLTGGRLELMTALKQAASQPGGGAMRSMRDLASLKRADFVKVVEATNISPDNETDREALAARLAKQVETLFPNEVFKAQYQPVTAEPLFAKLDRIQPLLARNEKLFGKRAFAELDLADIHAQDIEAIKMARADISRLVNRHPGLNLSTLLNDPKLSPGEKATEVVRRVKLMDEFFRLNPSTPVLSVSLLPRSEDFKNLKFGELDDKDRELILSELRAGQLMYRVTQDAEHAVLLMESGYSNPYDMARTTRSSLTATTGLSPSTSTVYHVAAQKLVTYASAATGTVLDAIAGGLELTAVDNTSTEVDGFLRELSGYADYFGNQAYCHCCHCQSIISPAAYFVDLMEFIERSITGPSFPASVREEYLKLKLRNRRRDLWNGIPLTCEATNALVPYLKIVNEILENYIFRPPPAPIPDLTSLPERPAIEGSVYPQLYNRESSGRPDLDSFRQPFMLPLERLQIYLSHFPITRAEVVSAVLEHTGDSQEIIPQARLGLSLREYNLIRTAPDDAAARDDAAFLSNLYGRKSHAEISVPESGEILRLDVQWLLAPMQIKRKELGDLIQARFVTTVPGADAPASVSIRDETSPGAVQPDVEYIYGLNRKVLGRMHRFVRLWRRVPWTIRELDLVLTHLLLPDTNLPLPAIASLLTIQQRLKVSVEELCALFSLIPSEPASKSEPSMFDRLFNRPSLAHTTRWDADGSRSSNGTFLHPGLTELAEPASTTVTMLHRLLAGLNVTDETLLFLLRRLRDGLDHPEAGEESVNITQRSLSLLYRHARLASLLKLSVPDLFQLLSLTDTVPDNRVDDLDDLEALLASYDWWKTSNRSLDDLAFVTRGEVRNPDAYPSASDVADRIQQRVQENRALIFADTSFALIAGVTEEQSQTIVALNYRAFLVPAGIDLAPARITLPESITATLVEESARTDLISALSAWLAAHRSPATPGFLDTALAGVRDLSAAQSQAIVAANPTIFQAAPSLFAPADLHAYRIKAGADLATLSLGDGHPADELERLTAALIARLEVFQNPGAPPLPETALAGVSGFSADASRALFRSNPAIFEPVNDGSLFWLRPECVPGTSILIPSDVPLTQETVWAHLTKFYVRPVLVTALAAELNLSSEKLETLLEMSNHGLSDATAAGEILAVLQRGAPPTPLQNLISDVGRLRVLLGDSAFSGESLQFIQSNSAADRIFSTFDFRAPSIGAVQAVVGYRRFLGSEDADLAPLHRALQGFQETGSRWSFSEEVLDDLSSVLKAERGLVTTLNRTIPLPDNHRAILALTKLRRCVELAQYLGAGAEMLSLAASTDYAGLDQAADALFASFRTKYETEEKWEEKIGPFESKLRERKRDALTDYVLHTLAPGQFKNANDLYHWFLIDTEMGGCARTSVVVAGISSLQLYVQRCLMNLEQSADGRLRIRVDSEAAQEWEWRQNYRVWEANRKVFLWPENYIQPEGRDDKSPLFVELESDLLQKEITDQSVLDAYAKYMQGFDEIARLKIAGSYHDRSSNQDVLHLFGVTSSEPPVYYYRTVENIYRSELPSNQRGIVWHPWQKVTVQIPVRQVSPVVHQGRLHVFWVEIITQPKNRVIGGSSRFDGYEHKMAVKFTTLRLDGTWGAPQSVSLNAVPDAEVISDPLIEAPEMNSVRDRLQELWRAQLPTRPFPENETDSFVNTLLGVVERRGESILDVGAILVATENTSYGGLILNDPVFRKLFVPKYGEGRVHIKPIEGYTLSGFRWAALYPSPNAEGELVLVGRDFEIKYALDFYQLRLKSGPSVGSSVLGPMMLPTLKRLQQTADGIDFGYPYIIRDGQAYADAVKATYNLEELRDPSPVVETLGGSREMEIAIVNGTLTDGIINLNGDLFLLHSRPNSPTYILKRLGTTLREKMGRTLFESGVEALLNVRTQESLQEAPSPLALSVGDAVFNDARRAVDKAEPDFTGSLGVYFREIFFHVPALIANHLNSQGKFAEADRWYRFILDPTSNAVPDLAGLAGADRALREKDRVWQYVEFRNHTVETMLAQLNNQEAIERYTRDPFNPHAIARCRLTGHMKNIFMKFIDNHLDLGDQKFALDTPESINEAMLHYVLAADLLGERPPELGDCAEEEPADQTYEAILHRMESCDPGEMVSAGASFGSYRAGRSTGGSTGDSVDLMSDRIVVDDSRSDFPTSPPGLDLTPTDTGSRAGGGVADYLLPSGVDLDERYFRGPQWMRLRTRSSSSLLASFSTSLLSEVCVFCIPPNKDLLDYWDRVNDRLNKIRNCMNISGDRRQLALFAPPIDPNLLVRAKAAGLSLEDVLNATSGDVPPYRFSFLILKSKEYAAALQGFGAALLSAHEKKNAEELAIVRLTQQKNLLQLTTQLRDQEVKAAETALESLNLRKQTVTNRRDYHKGLIETGLTTWEDFQLYAKHTGSGLMELAQLALLVGAKFAPFPAILGFSFSTPADGAKETADYSAGYLRLGADLANRLSDSAALEATFQRREQGWEFSLQQANDELKEIEKQIVGAEIRKDMAIRSREIHQLTMDQQDELFDFYKREKFSNLSLYTWLSTSLQRLHREAYQSAYSIAQLAERAYRFERGDEGAPILQGNYWDPSRAGLLAGERLMGDLRVLEQRFMETHYRSLEVDQAFSLTQIDPAALIQLKQTGTCEFSIPEFSFDLFYPGHYRRRIKSARLTIPCITGPYANVSATLTLVGSAIRTEPKAGDEYLVPVPPTRSTTIATSTAQNDSGVFRLDFRDERYMPFEGAGAVSSWRLALPKNLRPFDYATINDVILHISYCAESDGLFREEIEKATGRLEAILTASDSALRLKRIFSLRQEFSTAFHNLLHNAVGETVRVELADKHFPLFLQGKKLTVLASKIILDGDPPSSTPLRLRVMRGEGAMADLSSFSKNTTFGGLPTADLNVSFWSNLTPYAGPLEIRFKVTDPGDFRPASHVPSDLSALDETKLRDVYLYLEYRVSTS